MRHLAGEDISDGLAALDKKIKEQTAAQQQQKKRRANENRSATQKRNWEGMTAEERQRRLRRRARQSPEATESSPEPAEATESKRESIRETEAKLGGHDSSGETTQRSARQHRDGGLQDVRAAQNQIRTTRN